MTTSILGRARKRHAYIVFVDEAGFMLAPLLRRTWAPRGCTPVVRISEPHGRISVIGAITISPERRHFCFYFQLSADNTNLRGESVVQFIEYVRRKVPGPITLLWDQILIYAHGTVRQILAQNWVEWKQELPTQGFAIYAVALFMLGMWVWRAGIVQRLGEHRAVLKRVCAWCIPVGLVLSTYVGMDKVVNPAGTFSGWRLLAEMLWLPGSQILAAGYVSGLALIFLDEDWRRYMLPFAAVGRTALTNYLLQSVLCSLFFYHYTTGLFERIGPALGLVPTGVLFAAQVVVSNWWLKRYRFGPIEWVWRGMTYGKLPSMWKEDAEAVMEAPMVKPVPPSGTEGGAPA